MGYRKTAHSVYDLKYHVVWITKYRKPILHGAIGMVLFGAGVLATALWARTLSYIVVLLVIIGVDNTTHTVLSYPLLTELVPPERIGEFWGFNTFFASAAALVSAVLAGWFADLFGSYRPVFVLTGLCLLAATAVLTFVHPEWASLQIQGE
jgi:MFS family permease